MTDHDAPPDPRSAPAVRWGILGAGGIASVFTEAVTAHTQSAVVAVGSRAQGRADEFAARHAIPRAHGSYEALVADPDVQVVYAASPHPEHLEHALLAIAAGKHVLVEKAFTVNAAEAERASTPRARPASRDGGHVHPLPAARGGDARRPARGEIGEPVGVIADHGQNMGHHPATHRLHDRELAGGALLDLGVTPSRSPTTCSARPTGCGRSVR